MILARVFDPQTYDLKSSLNSKTKKTEYANMLPQRTEDVRISTAIQPNALAARTVYHHPQMSWEPTIHHSANKGMQRVNSRHEKIIAQIYAEYSKLSNENHQLLIMNHEMRDDIQKKKDEQTRLEAHIRYQDRFLQAAEKRAWRLEERVNQLEVELASRDAGALSTDPTGHA